MPHTEPCPHAALPACLGNSPPLLLPGVQVPEREMPTPLVLAWTAGARAMGWVARVAQMCSLTALELQVQGTGFSQAARLLPLCVSL